MDRIGSIENGAPAVKLEVLRVERGSLSGEPYYLIGGIVEGFPGGPVLMSGHTFVLQMPETCYRAMEGGGVNMEAFFQGLLGVAGKKKETDNGNDQA